MMILVIGLILFSKVIYCDVGWCMPGIAMTWQEAEDECQERAAHLVAIPGDINLHGEKNMVYTTLKNEGDSYWAGLRRSSAVPFAPWNTAYVDGSDSTNTVNTYFDQTFGLVTGQECATFNFVGVPVVGDPILGENKIRPMGDEDCNVRNVQRNGLCRYYEFGEDDGCGVHGKSHASGCVCDFLYGGENCSIPLCQGVEGRMGCSSHGDCTDGNVCECEDEWSGDKFCRTKKKELTCFGIPYYHNSVCRGHGQCIDIDECECDVGYENTWDCRIENTTFMGNDICSKERLNTTEDWIYFNRSCWFFEVGSFNYENLIAECKSKHPYSHPISIHSDEENYFVKSKIWEYYPLDTGNFYTGRTWIGAIDILFEDNFHWIDGSVTDYYNWSTVYNEPNNFKGNWWGGENQLLIYRNGEWHDYPYTSPFNLFCRLRLHTDDALPYTTPWDRVKWNVDVPFPASEKVECDLLTGECPDMLSTCFGFRYDYEEACGGVGVCYSYDRCNCTGTGRSGKACAEIDCSKKNLGDDGWEAGDISSCWKFFSENHTSMTWYEAENFCRSQHPNAHLASIHAIHENDWMLKHTNGRSFWIGLNDIVSEGEFVWTDGTDVDFQVFMKNQPDNSLMNQHYGKFDSWRGYWKDEPKDPDVYTTIACKIRMFFKDGHPHSSPWDNVVYYDLDLSQNGNLTKPLYCNLTIDPLVVHPCPNFMMYCYDKIFADNDVCGGSNAGYCESWDLCTCINGYFGTECGEYYCNGMCFNDSDVCNRNPCAAPDQCDCKIFGEIGDNCDEIMKCNNIDYNKTDIVCNNGKGTCVETDLCVCNTFGWRGKNCDEKMKCEGIDWDSGEVCNNAKGNCVDDNVCECTEFGYYGQFCENLLKCGDEVFNSEEVCNNKKGNCLEIGECNCTEYGYFGVFCEEKLTCNDVEFDNKDVCGNKGECVGNGNIGVCYCDEGYAGYNCEYKNTDADDDNDNNGQGLLVTGLPVWAFPIFGVLAVVVLLLIIISLIVGTIFACYACRNKKEENSVEQEMDEMEDMGKEVKKEESEEKNSFQVVETENKKEEIISEQEVRGDNINPQSSETNEEKI